MPIAEDHVGLTLDRIVFATDFSPSAQRAEGYALGLAKRFSSTLSLTHVARLPIASCPEPPAPAFEAMRRTSVVNQERLLREMTSAGVRTVAHTLEARNPAEAIVCFANELRADLIVTGTTQPHGLDRAVHGSCAEEIIRHAGCPVLTVGPNAKPAPQGRFCFHTVVFATDFSSHAALQTAVALSFARESIAQIYLCHVLDH
ncbi:MAG: universal stress protein, partial [Acidobacteria bacterium]|nr:universal stress protein [Acidobacteriota bacterium]